MSGISSVRGFMVVMKDVSCDGRVIWHIMSVSVIFKEVQEIADLSVRWVGVGGALCRRR
jgi:hypothetical protein